MNATRWARLTAAERERHSRWELANAQRRADWLADHAGHRIVRNAVRLHCETCASYGEPEARRRQVQELTRRGLSATQIADRLWTTSRTVERDRARLQASGRLP